MKTDRFIKVIEDSGAEYICKIINEKISDSGYIDTEVVAVIKYPSQYAIIFKQKLAPKKPYEYGSIKRYKDFEAYTGAVTEYRSSILAALDEAINQACLRNDKEVLEVLMEHKKLYKKSA